MEPRDAGPMLAWKKSKSRSSQAAGVVGGTSAGEVPATRACAAIMKIRMRIARGWTKELRWQQKICMQGRTKVGC